jgi:hypothetical protein
LRRLSSVGSHFIFAGVWKERRYLIQSALPVTTKSQSLNSTSDDCGR